MNLFSKALSVAVILTVSVQSQAMMRGFARVGAALRPSAARSCVAARSMPVARQAAQRTFAAVAKPRAFASAKLMAFGGFASALALAQSKFAKAEAEQSDKETLGTAARDNRCDDVDRFTSDGTPIADIGVYIKTGKTGSEIEILKARLAESEAAKKKLEEEKKKRDDKEAEAIKAFYNARLMYKKCILNASGQYNYAQSLAIFGEREHNDLVYSKWIFGCDLLFDNAAKAIIRSIQSK